MTLYPVQEKKTKNGSYKIPVMTSNKILQQFGYAVEEAETSTAFAFTHRHPLHSTARIQCMCTHTHAYTQ